MKDGTVYIAVPQKGDGCCEGCVNEQYELLEKDFRCFEVDCKDGMIWIKEGGRR
jgi:hypothetical protein